MRTIGATLSRWLSAGSVMLFGVMTTLAQGLSDWPSPPPSPGGGAAGLVGAGAAATTRGWNAWLPWVLLGVVVLLLIIVFVVVLVVVISSGKKRERALAAENERNRQAVEDIQRQLEEQRRLADERQRQAAVVVDEMPPDSHGRTKTKVYGKTKLALFLIDKATGVSYPLPLHKTNPDGRVIEAPKYKVGTLSDCDICLTEPSVSHEHCDLYADYEGKVYVFDHNTTNGTVIERAGQRIAVRGAAELKDGDQLILGDPRVGAACFRVVVESVEG